MIYKDSINKTSGCSFKYGNYKCRKKYKILINSFYELFLNKQLKLVSQVMKCFLVYNFNTQKAKEYLDNECKVIISLRSISDI